MQGNNLFYKYYDKLYSDKNYKLETDYLFSLVKSNMSDPINKILEIGCGTGNHTKEIAKKNIPLTAIDIDSNMVAIAKRKLPESKFNHINLACSGIENLHENNFNLALAMFNVITYIDDTRKLLSFFSEIQKRLTKKGLFIFDCWNGLAALLDPPKTKIISKQTTNEKIYCKINSSTNLWNQVTTMKYNLNIKNLQNNTTIKDNFSFNQTLWTPKQLEFCLNESGFKIIECGKLFNIKENADYTDWKIMYVCKIK